MSLPGSSPTPDDRLLAALRDIIRERFPGLAYAGVYEYAVQSVGAGTVELLPTADIPFTSLPPVAFPLAAYTATGKSVTVGTTCLVCFVNADPARPTMVPRVGDVVMGGKSTWVQTGPSVVTVTHTHPDGSTVAQSLTVAGAAGVTIAIAGSSLTNQNLGVVGVGS